MPAHRGFRPSDRLGHLRTAVTGARPLPRAPLGSGPGGGTLLDHPEAAPKDRFAAWRWFLYAFGGFLAGQLIGTGFGVVAGALAGKTSAQMTAITGAAEPPAWYVLSTLLGLWVGFFGAPWLASRTHGTRHFLADLGVRFRWVDLWGIAIGVAAQAVIALLYAPFQHDIHNFDGPTNKLTGGAHGVGFLLIALATVLVVPFMEELIFRGLLFRSLLRLFTTLGPRVTQGVGVALAIVADGLLFGLAHGEWVQLAGLAFLGAVLATVSYRTGRLGMNMLAHASFNLVAVVGILQQRGGVIH
jgi:membrane protease YdiL (CAAX protease family)